MKRKTNKKHPDLWCLPLMRRTSIYKVFWVKVTVTLASLYQSLSSLVTFNMLQFFQYKFDSNWQPGFMFTCVLSQESRGFGGGQCVFISHLLGEKKVSDICGEMHEGKNLWEDFEFTIVISFT